MYNVLTAIKSNMLLQELKRLHIWGASTGFEICEVTSDFATLTEHLRKNRYQLVLLEASESSVRTRNINSVRVNL